jgi:hypothetical protein
LRWHRVRVLRVLLLVVATLVVMVLAIAGWLLGCHAPNPGASWCIIYRYTLAATLCLWLINYLGWL